MWNKKTFCQKFLFCHSWAKITPPNCWQILTRSIFFYAIKIPTGIGKANGKICHAFDRTSYRRTKQPTAKHNGVKNNSHKSWYKRGNQKEKIFNKKKYFGGAPMILFLINFCFFSWNQWNNTPLVAQTQGAPKKWVATFFSSIIMATFSLFSH